MNTNDITLLTPAQVSRMTSIPVATLKKWRAQRRHLPYVHMGRSVYYKADDIRAYIDAHVVHVAEAE